MSEKTGVVTNIQRYTIHDGPGIRTEVFLKGCPLNCKWCSNPEAISPQKELGIYPIKCIGFDKCGLCAKACPLEGKPLVFDDNKLWYVQRDICLGCLKCTESCFLGALKPWGDEMTVDEVMKEVLADKGYFDTSGGGITISGGEVAVQWEFTLELLKACRENGVHTCVESSMQCAPEILERFYPYTDLMITDIKSMDTDVHKKWCGAGNEQILKNIKQTVDAGVDLIIRIPILPEINNSEENIRKTAEFIRDELGNKIVQLQLLPYRKMGTDKYDSLQLEYPMGEDYKMPDRIVWERNLLELRDIMREYGVPAEAGASEKIE